MLDVLREKEKQVRVKSKLKALMLKHGVSRMDVVRGAGLSYPTVVRWEEDRVKRYDVLTVSKLRQFFECAESDLLEVFDEGGEE